MATDVSEAAEPVYRNHGFTPEGIACLKQVIHRDAELLDAAVSQCAYDALREQQRQDRAGIAAGQEAKRYTAEQQEKVIELNRGFLARPLMDGTPLGKATLAQLLRDAGRYEKNAEGNAREARFLKEVARRVERRKARAVEDVWKEPQLRHLYEQVRGK